MKYVLLFVSVLIASACGSEKNQATVGSKPNSTNVESYPPNSEILDYSDTPGLSQATVKVAGNVHQQGDYLNNKRNGSWTEYHGNGVVNLITTYVNGNKQGIEVEIDDRGNLLSKSYYHNGEFDGECLKYNRGKIIERKTYQNGVLSGMLAKYYKDGKIQEESPYENGKIHGIAKWYDQQGNITLEYEYDNGEFVKKVE